MPHFTAHETTKQAPEDAKAEAEANEGGVKVSWSIQLPGAGEEETPQRLTE